MCFLKKEHCLRKLGLATMVAGAIFFLMPFQGLPMESPFDLARAVVQEMLGDAITADALARTDGEKGRAQERMGFAIFNLALIDLEEPRRMYVPMSQDSFSQNPGKLQELLGEVIMEAAWAQTYGEKAWAQEVLGILIVNKALLGLNEFPIGSGREAEPGIRIQ